ncbi:unnamed protein product [Umbelopsis ramanniana]
MRQLITQFKRLFHPASSAKYHDAAAVATTKHVIPISDHKHHLLPQARRQPLQPLQPKSRAVISPAALPITPSTPITEKVPILRQCQATNRHNGKQCSRTFKGEIETFCFQHCKIPPQITRSLNPFQHCLTFCLKILRGIFPITFRPTPRNCCIRS